MKNNSTSLINKSNKIDQIDYNFKLRYKPDQFLNDYKKLSFHTGNKYLLSKSIKSNNIDFNQRDIFKLKFQEKNYSHVKTILGHMSLQDDMLGPVPIYCVLTIDKLDIVVTGDSNG